MITSHILNIPFIKVDSIAHLIRCAFTFSFVLMDPTDSKTFHRNDKTIDVITLKVDYTKASDVWRWSFRAAFWSTSEPSKYNGRAVRKGMNQSITVALGRLRKSHWGARAVSMPFSVSHHIVQCGRKRAASRNFEHFSEFSKSLKEVTRAYLSGQHRIPNRISTCNPRTTSLAYIKRSLLCWRGESRLFTTRKADWLWSL